MRDPFCCIATTQTLGWPKNISHATAPHAAIVARFAQRAAEVLALSATGEELTGDLVVTEGHKHNTEATLREWRQLAAWPIVGRTLASVVRIGQVIDATSEEDVGFYFFRVPLDSGGVRVRDILYPRLRATVGPGNHRLIVSGELIRLGAFNAITTVATLPALNIFSQVGPPVVSRINQWFSFGAIEIPSGTPATARFGLRLRAKVANGGEEGTLFEVAVGLRGGL